MNFDTERIVFISIKPNYAFDILNLKKKWEYRRISPQLNTRTRMMIYASGEVQAVVGDCVISEVVQTQVKELIDLTIAETTSTREGLQEYFKGLKLGSALKLENPYRYERQIPLSEIRERIPDFMPPQNFFYLKVGDSKLEFLFDKVVSEHKNEYIR